MLEDMKRIIKIRRAHPHLIRPGRMGERQNVSALDYEADEILPFTSLHLQGEKEEVLLIT